MPDDEPLLAALAAIRERGAIGESSLPDAVRHADGFVAAIPHDASTVIDLGSGGGLPGLVIAWRRPTLHVTLVERRRSRADLLRRAAASLDLTVEVLDADVRTVAAARPHAVDVVTARSFASPDITARWGSALLVGGGLLLVSEPPSATPDRWPAALVASLGLHDQGVDQGIRTFRRAGMFHVEHPAR